MRDDNMFEMKPSIRPYFPVPILGLIAMFIDVQLGFLILAVYAVGVLDLKFTTYFFNTETLRVTEGVLSRKSKEIYYYRMKSVNITRDFWSICLGLYHIEIITMDPNLPVFTMKWLHNGYDVRETIKRQMEEQREVKGVKTHEVHNL